MKPEDKHSLTSGLPQAGRDFRILVNSVKDYAIFMLDQNGFVRSWNTGAREIKGYSESEIIGQHMSRFYTAEDVAAGKPQALLGAAAREGRAEDEGWRVRKDGSRFWADVVISAVRDDSGEVVGFIKVTRDLTARRQAEDLLRQSESQMRLLIDSVRDYAIFRLDSQGRVTSWNPGAERVKGWKESEIVGKHISVFYTPEDQAQGKPAGLLALAAAEGRAEDEGWRVRKDGSRFWADAAISSIRDPLGRLVGFAKITRDQTDRRRLEQDLVARSAALGAANRELEAFSYSVSHDLRAPLRGMDGFSKAVLREYGDLLPEQGRNYLERIHRAAGRMSELIDDLLALSRITRVEIERKPVDLTRMALDVIGDLRKQDPDRHVETVVAPGLTTAGDPRLLQIALENLIGNAWKFTGKRPDARIEVGSRGGDGRKEFFVQDNGAGFDMAYADKLFAPFQRLHTEREFEGTGVGLASVYRIIARHGGRIWVEAEPGKGATFWFTIGAE